MFGRSRERTLIEEQLLVSPATDTSEVPPNLKWFSCHGLKTFKVYFNTSCLKISYKIISNEVSNKGQFNWSQATCDSPEEGRGKTELPRLSSSDHLFPLTEEFSSSANANKPDESILGRTWQPFIGGKNGHENFLEARIFNFCDKCDVIVRNRKFANLTR